MMIRRALFLVCAAICSRATCNIFSRDDYLNLPSTQFMQQAPGGFKRTQTSLLAINVEKNDGKESILEKINESYKLHEDEVYRDLLRLAAPTESCEPEMTRRVLEIFALARDAPDDSFDPFVRFSSEFGKRKFGICARMIEANPKMAAGDDQAESALEQFFKAALGLRRMELSDAQWWKALKAFEMARDNFHARKALAVAKNLGFSSAKFTKGRSFRIFTNFLAITCVKFERGREATLGIISLADALESPDKVSSYRLLKLQEYHRLCLSWQRLDKREATELNIKRQLRRKWTSLGQKYKRRIAEQEDELSGKYQAGLRQLNLAHLTRGGTLLRVALREGKVTICQPVLRALSETHLYKCCRPAASSGSSRPHLNKICPRESSSRTLSV